MYKVLFICLVFSSCSASRMVETNLFFGQTRPDGSLITEKEWNDFKVTHIARVFKEGSTVINSTGSWLDPETHKLITEPSNVVIYFYKKSQQVSQQIDSLRYWYKTLFQQQSVLRVDKKVKAFF